MSIIVFALQYSNFFEPNKRYTCVLTFAERGRANLIQHITVTPVAFTFGNEPIYYLVYYIAHSIESYLHQALPINTLSDCYIYSIDFRAFPAKQANSNAQFNLIEMLGKKQSKQHYS
jgi:hypothetical protein